VTDRKRDPLPKGYQFGDAGEGKRVILLEVDEFIVGTLPSNVTVHRKPPLAFHPDAFAMAWDGPSLSPREHIEALRNTWNDIERGEH
jgi:hypothetical protein